MELREAIGTKKHLRMKVTGSRLHCAGQFQRTSNGRLATSAVKSEDGGRRSVRHLENERR